jgi:hypothetical protein
MQDKVTDDELRELIHTKAEEHDLPPELLIEIYEAEREVVNMDRRSSILQDIRSMLEDEIEGSPD